MGIQYFKHRNRSSVIEINRANESFVLVENHRQYVNIEMCKGDQNRFNEVLDEAHGHWYVPSDVEMFMLHYEGALEQFKII